MANDIFGYNKSTAVDTSLLPPGAILVSISSGAGADTRLNLVQTVEVNYQRDVEPVYELGSENVYLVTGKSRGDIRLSRLIGDALKPYLPGSACTMQKIAIRKGSSTCGNGQVSLVADGMLQQVTMSANAGQLTVTDGATFVISSLTSAATSVGA